jgi:hypothetical protein
MRRGDKDTDRDRGRDRDCEWDLDGEGKMGTGTGTVTRKGTGKGTERDRDSDRYRNKDRDGDRGRDTGTTDPLNVKNTSNLDKIWRGIRPFLTYFHGVSDPLKKCSRGIILLKGTHARDFMVRFSQFFGIIQ